MYDEICVVFCLIKDFIYFMYFIFYGFDVC